MAIHRNNRRIGEIRLNNRKISEIWHNGRRIYSSGIFIEFHRSESGGEVVRGQQFVYRQTPSIYNYIFNMEPGTYLVHGIAGILWTDAGDAKLGSQIRATRSTQFVWTASAGAKLLLKKVA